MMEIILALATIGQKFRLKIVADHKVELMPAMSLRAKKRDQGCGRESTQF